MADLKFDMSTLQKRAALREFAWVIFGGVLCLALTGYFGVKTGLPASLSGDHLVLITMAKSYINGHGFRLDSQLGYPDVRDTLYFPSFDLSYRTLLWLEGRVVHSPFRAMHGLYIVGLLAMFGFAYWTLRRLGVRSWLALVGSLATVVTPYLTARAYGHDFLALPFSAPLGLGLALSIGLSPSGVRLKAFLCDPFIVVAIIVVGTSGLYYAFFSLMFMAFAGVAASVGQRRWFPLLAVVGAGLPLFILLIFSGYGFDLPLVLSGKFAGPHREPYEQMLYGLNPAYAAEVFGRVIPKVAAGLANAMNAIPTAFYGEAPRGDSRGEWPAIPLTLALLCAPLLAAACQARLRTETGPGVVHLHAISFCSLLVVFALLFGVQGGLGFLFNLLFTPEIRADARLMPFLNVAAVVLLCGLAELAFLSRPVWLRYGAPSLIALLMAASMHHDYRGLEKIQKSVLPAPQPEMVQASVPAMLSAKDRANLGVVLQLPVASWAETPPIHGFNPYDHELAYIYDKLGSRTRWSYGANQSQPWFSLVDLSTRQPATLVAHARTFGFDGLLIQKGAYDPIALSALQSALAGQLAPSCLLYEDQYEVLYGLTKGTDGKAC